MVVSSGVMLRIGGLLVQMACTLILSLAVQVNLAFRVITIVQFISTGYNYCFNYRPVIADSLKINFVDMVLL